MDSLGEGFSKVQRPHHAPKDYIDERLKAIVGIEVEIRRLEGKFKLSQNRERQDRWAAGEALKRQGDNVLGQAMLDAIPSSLS